MPVKTVRSQSPLAYEQGHNDHLLIGSDNIWHVRSKGMDAPARSAVFAGSRCTAIAPDGTRWARSALSGDTVVTVFPGDYYPFSARGGPNLTLPTVAGSTLRMKFSPGGRGQYLAVAHDGSPRISIYDTFSNTKLANPATLPTSTGRGVAWSADGEYLAVAHDTSPFMTVYQITRPTAGADPLFTKLTNPGTLPNSQGQACAFSPPSQHGQHYLAVGSSSAGGTVNSLMLFTVAGTTLTHRQTVVVAEDVNGMSWSPDGQWLAIAVDSGLGNRLRLYRLTATNTLTLVHSLVPAGVAQDCSFSGDGRYVAVGVNASPFIQVYAILDSTIPVVLPNPSTLPAVQSLDVEFWQNVRPTRSGL